MPQKELDLSLIYEERTGDFLFLLGTILAIISNFQAEQSLLTEEALKFKPIEENSAMTTAAASWLFFLASILFTHVSIMRLANLESASTLKTSLSFIKGTKLVVPGNLLKTAGFGIAAIAYQLKLIHYHLLKTVF
ncbi:hypothetical protein ACHOLT_18535 [Desulfitobacterium sp. Sab5]|uniref:hypothetical protein n=1 Tax=Desulfitobacterium nosdiversum TaxID=3375356 RepID=UPI003CF2DF93